MALGSTHRRAPGLELPSPSVEALPGGIVRANSELGVPPSLDCSPSIRPWAWLLFLFLLFVLLLFFVCGAQVEFQKALYAASPDSPLATSANDEEGAALDPLSLPKEGDTWRPAQGKYLMAFCLTGRIGNQMFCLRNSLDMAAILNRSLIIPTWGLAVGEHDRLQYKFPWDLALDYRRMARCLEPHYGPHAVLGMDTYLQLPKSGGRINVTRLLCLRFPRAPCLGRASKLLLQMHSQLSLPDASVVRRLHELPRALTPADIRARLGSLEDDVIAVSKLFYLEVGGPLPEVVARSPECKNLWRPHEAIMEFVQGIAESFFGQGVEYAAFHFRRGDFYKHFFITVARGHAKLKAAGFSAVADAATELREHLIKRRIRHLFIASDAREYEMQLLKSILRGGEPPGVDVILTLKDVMAKEDWLRKQPWAVRALGLRDRTGSEEVFNIMVDKFLCVKAKYFVGSPRSSLSYEIGSYLRPQEGLEA